MVNSNGTGGGNWSSTATWAGGAVPGDNDDAVILAGDTVVLDVADQCKSVTVLGTFTQNADLTLTDAVGCGITYGTTGNYSSNGTAATHRIIKSASTSPTNLFNIICYDVVGKDSRTLNFAFVEFQGSVFKLGNETYYITCNNLSTDPKILRVTPGCRPPRLGESPVSNRYGGRVYPRGADSGTITITGVVRKDVFMDRSIDNIISSGQRISLFTRFHHLPKCYIERPSFSDPGGLWLEFSITLREDVP
jgi:hypothetical protein